MGTWQAPTMPELGNAACASMRSTCRNLHHTPVLRVSHICHARIETAWIDALTRTSAMATPPAAEAVAAWVKELAAIHVRDQLLLPPG